MMTSSLAVQRDEGAAMYAAARARHNADAATQCAEMADEALQDADSARAVSAHPSLHYCMHQDQVHR